MTAAISLEVYAALEAFAALEADQEEKPLLDFVDCLSAPMLGKVYDYVRDRDDGTVGWAVLLDPDEAFAEDLPYLGQYVGVAVVPSMSEPEARAAIQEPEGWARCTIPALVKSVKRTLTGDKNVYVVERYLGSAYRIWVRVLAHQCPDPAATLAAILEQKDIGNVLLFEVITGQAWHDVVEGWDDWGDVVANFDTWADLVVEPPQP